MVQTPGLKTAGIVQLTKRRTPPAVADSRRKSIAYPVFNPPDVSEICKNPS